MCPGPAQVLESGGQGSVAHSKGNPAINRLQHNLRLAMQLSGNHLPQKSDIRRGFKHIIKHIIEQKPNTPRKQTGDLLGKAGGLGKKVLRRQDAEIKMLCRTRSGSVVCSKRFDTDLTLANPHSFHPSLGSQIWIHLDNIPRCIELKTNLDASYCHPLKPNVECNIILLCSYTPIFAPTSQCACFDILRLQSNPHFPLSRQAQYWAPKQLDQGCQIHTYDLLGHTMDLIAFVMLAEG